MDQSGMKWTEWTKMDQIGLKWSKQTNWTEMDQSRLKWTEFIEVNENAMLMWHNRSVAIINATLQLLSIIQIQM